MDIEKDFRRFMKLWGPDPKDPVKNRRNLAFFSAIYALVIWPHELVFLKLVFDLEIDLIKALLTYVFTLAGTSIGGYLWACAKDDVERKKNVAIIKPVEPDPDEV